MYIISNRQWQRKSQVDYFFWRRLFLVLVMVSLPIWSEPTDTLAHGELIDANPPPGARLDIVPSELILTFSESNSAKSMIELYGVGFQKIDDVHTSVNPDKPEQLIATVPSLDKGSYTVQWQVISLDGHELRGSYTFEVIQGAPVPSLSNTWTYYGWQGPLAVIILASGVWWIMVKRTQFDKPQALP
jgi:methionine-rich copper-binding protein CopC